MANSRTATVLYFDTTATITENVEIEAIKFIGAASATAAITSADSSKPIWEDSGTTNTFNHVCVHAATGITVTIASGAKVYVYLK